MIHWAECRINLSPELRGKPTRVRDAGVHMDIFAKVPCVTGSPETKLIIRGKHAPKVLALLNLLRQSDADLAEAIRGSELAAEVEGLTDEECGKWARAGALSELRELAGEVES